MAQDFCWSEIAGPNLPSVINQGSNSSTISYGAWRNRYKQVAVTAGVTETTIYVGGLLERVTKGSVTEYRHLIPGGSGVAAIYTRRSSGSPATDTFYLHRGTLRALASLGVSHCTKPARNHLPTWPQFRHRA